MIDPLDRLLGIATEEGRTHWVYGAVLGAALWVTLQSEELSVVRKVGEGSVSFLFGIALGPSAAEWSGWPVVICAVAVAAFAPALLVGVRKALASQELVLSIIRRAIGGGK